MMFEELEVSYDSLSPDMRGTQPVDNTPELFDLFASYYQGEHC